MRKSRYITVLPHEKNDSIEYTGVRIFVPSTPMLISFFCLCNSGPKGACHYYLKEGMHYFCLCHGHKTAYNIWCRLSREKQKILTKGYQKGLTKLSQHIRNLESEKDFQHIEYCLRTFDTFCNNSICPAAQTFSVSGSQLAKAMGLLSITIFPLSYVSNQLCRFLWKQTGTETAATCSD